MNFEIEHDACGIGTVVQIDGKQSYDVLDKALHIVEKLEHRAGKDDDRQQDNGLAHRQVGDGQQLRESDNAHQDAGDYKHKEHHS